MMRSLSSAVSGLRAHQTKMDVIGNNIANVSTYGFKSSRVTFTDVYYQTLSSGNSPTNATGGTNPTQIGYGAKVATIDALNTVSSAAATDRAMDVYINGDGMIAVKDSDGNLMYTRLGVLGFDAMGRLVDINGNFVMGFPMGDDGTPSVNADGSVDIDDLSIIQVDTEILDELTGISISDSGEIIGTMTGDTEISLNKNSPAWLVDMTIDPESNITGNINVVMEAISTAQTESRLDWITSITSPANSMVYGNYVIEYDDSNGRITAVGDDGTVYTGTYSRNATIELTDAAGNVGFVIETHAYTQPQAGDTETLYFDCEYQVTLSGTDKGGNLHEQTISVGMDPTSMSDTLYFSELDVTLTVDTGLMEPTEQATLAFAYNDVQSAGYTWLLGAAVSTDSTLDGKIELQVGKEYGLSKYGGTYNNLNFMDWDALEEMLSDLNVTGVVTIEADTSSGSLVYQVCDDSGTVIAESDPINSTGDPIVFSDPTGALTKTWAAGTYTKDATVSVDVDAVFGTLSNFDSTAAGVRSLQAELEAMGLDMGDITIAANGDIYDTDGTTIIGSTAIVSGEVVVSINGGGSHSVGTTDATTLGAITTGTLATATMDGNITGTPNLGTMSTTNKIYLLENDVIVAETTYNGQSSLTIGDITLKVDASLLNDFFSNSATNISDGNDIIEIGTVTREEVVDWSYSRDAASASAGVGETFIIGQLAIATVRNMNGMTQEGDSYWQTSFNSGEASFWIPGLGGTGTLTAGYLEQSNVDISQEFTDMITTQRGFQANTRIITVSDEMLQELVNLKR